MKFELHFGKRGAFMQIKNEKTIAEILRAINEYYRDYGESPTLESIAGMVGVSKATVSRYIAVLESRGLLERTGRYGSFKTELTKKLARNIAEYPVIGEIACGTPILAEENVECYVSLSEDVLGKGDYYILRAKGDSMINAGIEDGDIVIVRQQNTAEEGQIVVALIDGSEATLKRYYFERKLKRVRLHPENDEMEDMYFDRVDIQGVAVKVLKNLL